MRTLRLGRSGVLVSAVSLGGWSYGGPRTVGGKPVGWSGGDDRQARDALVRAYEVGINHWDTADVYGDGHSEAVIGAVWDRVPREAIFLATKVGWEPGSYAGYYHPDLIRRQLERSLANLRSEWIDLYYLHHCDFGPGDERLDGAVELLRRFRAEGKIRFIGLSDWDASKIARLADRVEPDVVQPYRNLLDDEYTASGLKAWIEAHDAGVAFFSPLKHGLLLGKYARPVSFPEGDWRRNIADFGNQALLDHLRRCREEVGRRFAAHPQPALHALVGALLSDAPTGCALLGLRNPDQVDAAAAAGEPLAAADAAWVRALYRYSARV